MNEITFANCDRTKINLGSGKSYRPDCWNIDINPKFKPDILCNMMELKCDKNLFTEVLMYDVLIHLKPNDARVMLRKVLGWLKPDGVLRIRLPNLDWLVEVLYKSEDENMRHEALKWMYGTDGIGTTDYESNMLRWAYTKQSLTELLEDVGFKILGHYVDCNGFSLSVDAQKC